MLQTVVEEYVSENKERFTGNLQTLCRQESVSASGRGIEECASLVLKMMEGIGIETRIFHPPAGNPIVFGEVKSPGIKKTLIFYNHYDVQPPEPLELWKSDPFAADIRDGTIFSRGVEDNKGNLIGKLCATESILKTFGRAPMNLKFVFEGEEEVGSPSLPKFVLDNQDMLKADVCIGEGGPVNSEGRPIIRLGNKGLLYVELRVRTAGIDQHSQEAAISPNPAWRLLWALNSLKDEYERIKIEGFYSAVRKYSPDEITLIRDSPFDEEERRSKRQIKRFLLGLTGDDLKVRYFEEPTCNIDGLLSGYVGKGVKTVLPAEAVAKLDFRLVPDQNPKDILEKLKRYLNRNGFGDIEVSALSELEPSRTPPTNPYAVAAAKSMEGVYGKKPVIELTSAGSGPRYLFEGILRSPMINAGGAGNTNSFVHGPNENVRIQDFISSIKANCALIVAFSEVN